MNQPTDDAEMGAMLERALVNLGAPAEQARIMAHQLIKRARQLASERRISEADAMRELLGKVVAGRKGNYTGKPPDGGEAA